MESAIARIRQLVIYSNAGKGHGAAEDAAYALFLKAVCGIDGRHYDQ